MSNFQTEFAEKKLIIRWVKSKVRNSYERIEL